MNHLISSAKLRVTAQQSVFRDEGFAGGEVEVEPDRVETQGRIYHDLSVYPADSRLIPLHQSLFGHKPTANILF